MTTNGQTIKGHSLFGSIGRILLPMLLTGLMISPMFFVKLKRPTWEEAEFTEDTHADLVDVSSAADDPRTRDAVANILAWTRLRTPDSLVLPSRELGFLAVVPSSDSFPDTTQGIAHIMERRFRDFNDRRFIGADEIPPPETHTLQLRGTAPGKPDFQTLPRQWEPHFSPFLPMRALTPGNTAIGIVWTDETGNRLKNAPRIPSISEGNRKTAGITRLELRQNPDLPIPRILVRASCGNPALDAAAVSALSAHLRSMPETNEVSTATRTTILNIIWNLK